MAFEPNDMSGALFINEPKEGETLHPDAPQFRGNILINGKEYKLSAWKKVSKNGVKYISLAASVPQPRRGQRTEQQAERQVRDAFDM